MNANDTNDANDRNEPDKELAESLYKDYLEERLETAMAAGDTVGVEQALKQEQAMYKHGDAYLDVPPEVEQARKTFEAIDAEPRPYDEPLPPPPKRDNLWIFTLSLSVITTILALILFNVSTTQTSQFAFTNDQARIENCRNAYTAVMSRTAAESRHAVAQLNSQIADALVQLKDGHPERIDSETILGLIVKVNTATVNDVAAVQARDAWDNAGQPVKPCPLTPVGQSSVSGFTVG